MIGIIATLKAREGKGAELEALFAELAVTVREKEKGCLSYTLTKSRTESDTYKVMELYADQAAVDHHMQTDYFKAAGAKIAACMAAKPDVELLDAV